MEIGGDRERVRERVRDRVEVVRAGKVGDPLRLSDAAARRVGLRREPPALRKKAKSARVHVLAGRDPDVEPLGQKGVPIDVVDQRRLLEQHLGVSSLTRRARWRVYWFASTSMSTS